MTKIELGRKYVEWLTAEMRSHDEEFAHRIMAVLIHMIGEVDGWPQMHRLVRVAYERRLAERQANIAELDARAGAALAAWQAGGPPN